MSWGDIEEKGGGRQTTFFVEKEARAHVLSIPFATHTPTTTNGGGFFCSNFLFFPHSI